MLSINMELHVKTIKMSLTWKFHVKVDILVVSAYLHDFFGYRSICIGIGRYYDWYWYWYVRITCICYMYMYMYVYIMYMYCLERELEYGDVTHNKTAGYS